MKKISIALAALLLAAALPVAVLAEGMTAPVTPEVPGTPAGSATAAPVTPAPVSPTAAAPTNTPAPKGIPVVTKDPKDETVKEGGRCPFTSRASNDKGRTWYFVSPDGEELLTVKEAKARFKGVAITGEHEEKLVITKTPYSMNGWKVLCNFYNSKGNVDSAMALITVIPKGTTAKPTNSPTPAPEGLPKITKNPTSETVTKGGRCAFVARAENADAYDWFFTKGKTTYTVAEALKKFKGLKVSGEDGEKLSLRKIPTSLNGWKVYCVFTNEKGEIKSKKASITVRSQADVTAKPTAKTTAAVTAKPTTTAKATAGVTTGTATDAPTTSAATDIPTPTPTVAPTDIPTATPTAAPSDVPEPPADTPVPSPIPEKDGGNTVLTVALAALGVLLVGGGAGTAVILSKRNKSTLTDEDDGDLDE